MAIFIFLQFFAALLYRLSRGDSIPVVKYPPKKFEISSAVAPMAKLCQILPCTSESHPHRPIRSLARAMGVTMGKPQNFADSIAVVLVFFNGNNGVWSKYLGLTTCPLPTDERTNSLLRFVKGFLSLVKKMTNKSFQTF